MKVFLHTSSALFTVCQYLARCSRYVLLKFGPIGWNGWYPYTFLFKNHAQNEHKMVHFLPIFGNKACFYMFSHVTQWVRSDYNKKIWKKCRVSIFNQFYAKNWPKYREIPLFSQKLRYLKITKIPSSRARKVF